MAEVGRASCRRRALQFLARGNGGRVSGNRVSCSQAPSAPARLVSERRIATVFMRYRQQRSGEPETRFLRVYGVVPEIAGDLHPRLIERLPIAFNTSGL